MARWAGGLTGKVEHPPPVENSLGRDGAEAHQVREHGQLPALLVDAVPMPDLAVAIAERGVGELERDVRLGAGRIEARALRHELGRERLPDQSGQIVVEQNPLVVPHRRPACFREQLGLGDPVLTQTVDEEVVGLEEGDVELVDEQVNIVAWVADQREPLLVARNVAASRAEQHLGRVCALVEVGAPGRAATVEALEVETGRSEVPQLAFLRVRQQRRPVGRDVVGDELADERPSRSHGGVVGGLCLGIARVARPSGRADHVEEPLVGRERRQTREHPVVAPPVDRSVDPATRRQAVVAGRHRLRADHGHGTHATSLVRCVSRVAAGRSQPRPVGGGDRAAAASREMPLSGRE